MPLFSGLIEGMASRLRTGLVRIPDLLFPRSCVFCGQDVPPDQPGALCRTCLNSISRWPGLSCAVCGVPLPDGGARCYVCRRQTRGFRVCRSVGLYDGVLKACLWDLKYGGKDFLASTLGRLLADLWRGEKANLIGDAVTAVPLHFWRRWRRGFNQADLLARSFCKEVGMPYLDGILIRGRATRSQTTLRQEERAANVERAFRVPIPARVRGRRLLLIDDVCTTGATLEACARALRQAGARAVEALVVARQVQGLALTSSRNSCIKGNTGSGVAQPHVAAETEEERPE
jgi:ComF family protein